LNRGQLALVSLIVCIAVSAQPSRPVQLGIYQDIPEASSSSNFTTHVLARNRSDKSLQESRSEGRTYQADEKLCQTIGFHFIANNNLGLFEIGDIAPMTRGTSITVDAPCNAHLKVLHGTGAVAEADGKHLAYEVKETGDYRLEASIPSGDGLKTWITTNSIRFEAPATQRPTPPDLSATVDRVNDITYLEGKPEDAAKHRLDLYVPKGKKDVPVLFFVHGGYWRSGDRAQYPGVGGRFANDGVLTVVISYRLLPKDKPPAQIEDVAAAFAWTVKHISEYGGDPSRIYIAGHSAGGHLVSLLASNGSYLKTQGLSTKDIKGVVSISGVYDVRVVPEIFTKEEQIVREASPLDNIHPGAPPFLITYCQWDYMTLPPQAMDFYKALDKAHIPAELVYVPKENHVSEIGATVRPADPTALAILHFMGIQPRATAATLTTP
jgi:acetyl esterase/lipase